MTKKVLLADESSICLEIEQELLRRLPVKIFTASSGTEALELARRLRPDLLCIDLDIGGMDGAACCRAIKDDRQMSGTNVIIMAHPVSDKLDACRRALCDAIVRKPVERSEFVGAARSLLAMNNRLLDRIPCRSTVSCRMGGTYFFGTLEDIAPRGMFIGCRQEMKIGTELTVRFMLPYSGAEPIEIAARVIWVNSGRGRRNLQLPIGFGVEFEGLDKETATQISEFIERSILWDKLPSEW